MKIHHLPQFYIVLFLMVVASPLAAQKTGTDNLVTVKLFLTGEGTPQHKPAGEYNFFAHATVTNNQDTSITFMIMECSWTGENWTSSNDSIFFRRCACDVNGPVPITLQPHHSISFYAPLKARSPGIINKKFKAGFLYFKNSFALFNTMGKLPQQRDCTIYWSNEVELKDNLFGYQVE